MNATRRGKTRKLSTKRKMQLMYKNASRHRRFRRLGGLVNFLFVVSLIVCIVCAILFLVAAILWPIVWILVVLVTLGLILLREGGFSIDPTPFLEGLAPVITTSLIIAGVLFAVRFLLDYLDFGTEVLELKKNPEENKHYLKIAGVVFKLKILKLIRFIALGAIIAAMVLITQATGFDTDKTITSVLAILALIVLVALPIINRIYANRQFGKISESVEIAFDEMRAGKSGRKAEGH